MMNRFVSEGASQVARLHVADDGNVPSLGIQRFDGFAEHLPVGSVKSGRRRDERKAVPILQKCPREEDAPHFSVGKAQESSVHKFPKTENAGKRAAFFAVHPALRPAVYSDFKRMNVKNGIE